MSRIKSVFAKEIKDSRGKPTIEVELKTDRGSFVASVPSGASTGKNEALELRDADGGMKTAIKNINKIIAPKLNGLNPENQAEIDKIMIEMDGTENKSKLGANAILAVSLAAARAGAASKKVPLYSHIAELCEVGSHTSFKIPLAMFNILEGGVHTDKKTNLGVQEFMIVPQKGTFAENLVVCNKIFNNLKDILTKNFGEDKLEMGFEGGFASPFSKTEQALYSVKNAIGSEDAKIALDFAASEFYENGKYCLDGRDFTKSELLEYYADLVSRFPIILIEDPFEQEDWQSWEFIVPACRQASDKLGREILIVGDDLTTTNIRRIREARNKSACNGVVIKLNQIGTLSETLEAIKMAKSFGWKIIVSHRSGETMDNFIADLAVGAGADFIKAGSPAKAERMVKYRRLIEIEQELLRK